MLVASSLGRTLSRMRTIPWLVIAPVIVVFGLLTTFSVWQYIQNQQLQTQAQLLQQQQADNLEEASYTQLQQQAARQQRQLLQQQLEQATSSATLEQQQTVKAIYQQYADVQSKLDRNTKAKLDSSTIQAKIADWGTQLLNQDFKALADNLTAAQQSLDQQWAKYQTSLTQTTASAPQPPTSQSSASHPAGYTSTTVSTSRGSFAIKYIKLPLSQVKVRTVSASSGNCTDVPCGAKTLAQYVSQQGGFAGINGTYFCPPDYSQCAGKAYSYNFAVYNTPSGGWVNQNALGWDALIGLAVFSGNSASFYQYPNQWGRGSVTAGITNSPGLLVHNGTIVMNDSKLDSYQKVKSTRGALGVGGGNIILAIISGASITDAAHAMKAIGASDALNLDGGGSAALYIDGNYKVGPGRLLPNAIVLTR